MLYLSVLVAITGYFTTSVVAQATGVPYCGKGTGPTVGDCQDILNNIDPNGQLANGAQLESGDCEVTLTVPDSSPGSFLGSEVQSIGQGIINSCDANGWGLDSHGNNVSMAQCTVCEYGTCAVCNAPAAKKMMMNRSRGARPLLRVTEEKPPKAYSKHLAKRQSSCQSPPNLPTVQFCADFQASTSDCIDLGNRLKGQTLTAPYTDSQNSCELAIEASTPNFQVQGDDIGQRIIDDANACNTNPGIVGEVDDTGADGYTFYFGQLCGKFGFGYDGCTE